MHEGLVRVITMTTEKTLRFKFLIFCAFFTGLIRFRNEQSCRKAIERSRVDEIVVQDVEVTVRMLRAADNSNGLGGIDLTRQYSNERKAYGK